ncbi:hypothetical protein FHG68_04390 [Leptospira weilii]|nr:hypothetical protein FHG67_04530 [Leptospira weilii]QDK26028.1 hypothetical protein FHG68_04390 [Leptospira weilii]
MRLSSGLRPAYFTTLSESFQKRKAGLKSIPQNRIQLFEYSIFIFTKRRYIFRNFGYIFVRKLRNVPNSVRTKS